MKERWLLVLTNNRALCCGETSTELAANADWATSLLRRKREAGSSLVEMAIVITFVLTVLFGMMGFGHTLYTYHFVSHASKKATRWAAVNGSTCNDDSSCNGTGEMNNGPASATDIQSYVLARVPPGIDSTQLTVTSSWPSVATNPPACSSTKNAPGCTVQVQVGYALQFIFPLLPVMSQTTPPCTQPGICLSSTSDMVIVH